METSTGVTNLFLIGPPEVGKSTIIQKVATFFSSIKIGGFVTEPVFRSDGRLGGYQLRSLLSNERQLFAERNLLSHSPRFFIKTVIFDTFGQSIMQASLKKASLIIADELGTMENEAFLFQQAIIQCLESERIVLGVLKQKSNPFLDSIKKRSDIHLFQVNRENRNRLPALLAAYVQPLMKRIHIDGKS